MKENGTVESRNKYIFSTSKSTQELIDFIIKNAKGDSPAHKIYAIEKNGKRHLVKPYTGGHYYKIDLKNNILRKDMQNTKEICEYDLKNDTCKMSTKDFGFEQRYNCDAVAIILPATLEEQEEQAKSISIDDLLIYGKKASENPIKEIITKIYYRNPYYKEFALKKANGVCQLCENKAPFDNKDGKPFLESHHIIPLAQGGVDDEKNVIALCPNCHRKIHILGLEEDVKKLKEKVKNYK